ncbi:MAG: cytochrome c-type biogenesis protein [Gammaproteobacteria bacterium]
MSASDIFKTKALLMVLLVWMPPALTAPEQRWPFEDAEQHAIFMQLQQELICPTCQGASLEESPAPIALDMRKAVYSQVKAGKTAAEIRQWMVERYGPTVTTRPVGDSRWFLWLLPLFAALAGAFALYRSLRT